LVQKSYYQGFIPLNGVHGLQGLCFAYSMGCLPLAILGVAKICKNIYHAKKKAKILLFFFFVFVLCF